MDFLNGYKGESDNDKRQAEIWHHRMDSTVEALSKKTNVPDSLMNAMLAAHQNAKTAWFNLERGKDGQKRKGPSADFDDGFTAEDVALCKKNVITAKKVKEAIDIDWYCIFGWLDDCKNVKKILEDIRTQRIENKALVITAASKEKEMSVLMGSFTLNETVYNDLSIVYYNTNLKKRDIIVPAKFVDNKEKNGFVHYSKAGKAMIEIILKEKDITTLAAKRESMRKYIFGEGKNFTVLKELEEMPATQIKEYREYIKTLPESQRAEWYLELQKHVPYHSQLDNNCSVAKGYQMCNVTALSMNFEALGVSNPDATRQFEDNIGEKLGKPKIFYAKEWISLAKQNGLDGVPGYPKNTKESLMSEIKPALEKGYSISMSLYPGCKGHIVRVQGIDEGGLWIDDPNGNCPLACKLDRQKCKSGYSKGTRNSSVSNAGNNNYYPLK